MPACISRRVAAACHQNARCKLLMNPTRSHAFDSLQHTDLITLQFCWSPKDSRQCALVTDKGQLLLGLLGEPLRPVDSYSTVTCASCSPDGQLLAVGSGQQVHVYNAQQHSACFDSKVDHLVGVTNQHQLEGNLITCTQEGLHNRCILCLHCMCDKSFANHADLASNGTSLK